MGKHEIWELRSMQSAPLNVKIALTKNRIREWVSEYGINGVYVSFSGGKDSTVLLHLAREIYPDIPAVFIDTGLEYPEIREFVKQFDNVEWIKPKLNFKQTIEKYGYPLISKEVSQTIYEYKSYEKHHHNGDIENFYRWKSLNGIRTDKDGNISKYNQAKWKFLLNAPFQVSHLCCRVMKKTPALHYTKVTGRYPITAQMASESRLRTMQWLSNGCNGFDLKTPKSNPMSFWTEQDILLYVLQNEINICSVYGDIIKNQNTEELKTTKCQRTGCMFCGFGCHLEKPGEGRFERLKETHPIQYNWIMKPCADGGLGYKDVIDWLNENGNLNIKY